MNHQLFLINFKSFMQKSLRKFARFKNSLYLCRRFRENHLRRWAAPQHKTSFLHSVCTILAPLKRDRDLAQLVAHTSGGREVAGSSPVIPTEKEKRNVFTQRLSALFMLLSNHLFKHQNPLSSYPMKVHLPRYILCRNSFIHY